MKLVLLALLLAATLVACKDHNPSCQDFSKKGSLPSCPTN